MMVYQTPGSNALDVADGVYKTMERLSKSFPNDVAYIVPFESVSVVKESIGEVVKTLLEALGARGAGGIYFPAGLAFYHYSGSCNSCFNNRYFHFLHSPGVYY